MRRSPSLTDRLARYFEKYPSITNMEFRTVFGAERLAPRINELRDRGHLIVTCTETDFEGKAYTKYDHLAGVNA